VSHARIISESGAPRAARGPPARECSTTLWRLPGRPRDAAAEPRAIRVLRVIARLNIGGPAYHVSMLSGRLDRQRFATLLVYGSLGEGEGSFESLARKEACAVKVLPDLNPELRPLADLRALLQLMRVIRSYRPQIVHTHTAKAGFAGRLAAVLSPGPRPIIVHTYHGHVLEGYFGRPRSALYRWLERGLARVTDCLIGVSRATVDDLVRLGVAPRDRFRVVPIGLDLSRFLQPSTDAVTALREQCGTRPGEVLVGFVGRLVPIKRVDVVLRAVAAAREQGVPVRLMVVGDGPCRASLEELAERLGIGDIVRFVGYLPDAGAAAAAAEIAILGSDNEGTPVALIEAAAAGRPAVATAVGGVPDVVTPETGLLVPAGDHAALARGLARLARAPELRAEMGGRAREHVIGRFSIDRLLSDVEQLYDELLAQRRMSWRKTRRAIADNGCA
jgi:glycosyltransferase involved in cell wall biosynthesis